MGYRPCFEGEGDRSKTSRADGGQLADNFRLLAISFGDDPQIVGIANRIFWQADD